MSNEESEYVCAISGRSPRETELVLDAPEEDDLDALPIGWIRVTVERRGINPLWLAMVATKTRVQAQLAQQIDPSLPPEEQAASVSDATMLVNAQFCALEARTPKYVTESVELFVRNPDEDKGVAAEWGKIAEALSFPATVTGGDEA